MFSEPHALACFAWIIMHWNIFPPIFCCKRPYRALLCRPAACRTFRQIYISLQSRSSIWVYVFIHEMYFPGLYATLHLYSTYVITEHLQYNMLTVLLCFCHFILAFAAHYHLLYYTTFFFWTNPSSVQTKQKKEGCLLWCIQVFSAENVHVWRAVVQLTL